MNRQLYAWRDGARAFRVNRHHKKRAWLSRDAAVLGVDKFFTDLRWLLFVPKNASLTWILNYEVDGPLREMLNMRTSEFSLFTFRKRGEPWPWSPSRFKRWEERNWR